MSGFKIELGQTVTDVITGFSGVVMARSQYLTQCNSYGVCPQELSKEGKKPDWEWFDEPRLQIKKGVKTIELVDHDKKTGGPHSKSEIAPGN